MSCGPKVEGNSVATLRWNKQGQTNLKVHFSNLLYKEQTGEEALPGVFWTWKAKETFAFFTARLSTQYKVLQSKCLLLHNLQTFTEHEAKSLKIRAFVFNTYLLRMYKCNYLLYYYSLYPTTRRLSLVFLFLVAKGHSRSEQMYPSPTGFPHWSNTRMPGNVDM